MLPVCSTTPSCSSHSQVSFHRAFRPLWSSRKYLETRYFEDDNVFLGLSNGSHVPTLCFKTKAVNSFDHLGSVSTGLFDELHRVQLGSVNHGQSYVISSIDEANFEFADQSAEGVNGLVVPDSTSTVDLSLETPSLESNTIEANGDALPSGSSFDELSAGVGDSISSLTNKAENSLKNSVDTIISSLTSFNKSISEAVDKAVGSAFSARDQVQESASNRLSSLSTDLKEAASKAALVSVDLLRGVIVGVEGSIQKAASFAVYNYASAKASLSPEIRDALNLSEERATQILSPVAAALQKVSVGIEGLEKSLGLDPTDPIVPFVLFLGTSGTLWAFYWFWSYGGYSGDLSPQSSLELLTGKEKTVLIDVRPEAMRERDGIPDLRRVARFRYASVTLPEIDGSVRKLLKGGKELDYTLLAAVIRNLKTAQDSYRVIVLDADGTCSKGIARSLRKLGVKRPYLVQGGFKSWMKQGLRIKELKQETALTVLNEEAEAILEDINPTPVQLLGYGVGLVAALYAVIEWEKTLQLIGVIGVGQTIYRRVASYESPEEFKQDVRLLLTPVTYGGKAISWVAGKAEANGIGLPTSPSSSDVQTRVLQAAAKHGSQPAADTEGSRSPASTDSIAENVDLKEA